MKIKVFKSDVFDDGTGLVSNGEEKINNFLKDKKVIDVKTNVNQLDDITSMIITILYE